jgi:4-hydroxy-2-oxoheptanedioate aldolase
MPRLKEKLADPKARSAICLCTIPSPVVTQALAAAGLDAVIVDLEHGAIGIPEAHAMIAATAGTDCAPMVRVPAIDPVIVKRMLDMGAEGIVYPLIRTAEDARLAVAAMRYPPEGMRGFGPFIAQSRWGTDLMSYPAAKSPDLICCLTIETAEAVANIDEICAVPGIDAIVPAPFDLSTDLGLMGQFDHPEFRAATARVEAAALAAGIPLVNLARNADEAQALFARGYRAIAGFDILWLIGQARAVKSWTAP